MKVGATVHVSVTLVLFGRISGVYAGNMCEADREYVRGKLGVC